MCESDAETKLNDGVDDPGFGCPLVTPTTVIGCLLPMSAGIGLELLQESQHANSHVSSVQTSRELAWIDERQTLIAGDPHVELLLIGEKSAKFFISGNKLAGLTIHGKHNSNREIQIQRVLVHEIRILAG